VKLIERALAVPGFALVEVVSNCHVLYGRMNDLGDASEMMRGMEGQTRRTNPVLLKRAAMPIRLHAPGEAETPPGSDSEGVVADARLPRGVIFERPARPDYSHRYHAMLDELGK
jgi:2-oxoglutarate ferredoxin oxidoreductase subunit beta